MPLTPQRSRLEQPIKPITARRIDDDVSDRAVVLNAAYKIAPVQCADSVGILLQIESDRGRWPGNHCRVRAGE